MDLGHNLYSTQYAHKLSELGMTVLLRFSSPISDGGREREERTSMRSMFVHRIIAAMYPAWYGSCSLFGFFDVDFIFEVPFTPATVNSPSSPAMLALALSSSSSIPTPSGATSDSAASNLAPSSSAHYDPFHANSPTPYTHTRCLHTHCW